MRVVLVRSCLRPSFVGTYADNSSLPALAPCRIACIAQPIPYKRVRIRDRDNYVEQHSVDWVFRHIGTARLTNLSL